MSISDCQYCRDSDAGICVKHESLMHKCDARMTNIDARAAEIVDEMVGDPRSREQCYPIVAAFGRACQAEGDRRWSMTFGDLPEAVRESDLIEPHVWDNKNISEQRDWAVAQLASVLNSRRACQAEALEEAAAHVVGHRGDRSWTLESIATSLKSCASALREGTRTEEKEKDTDEQEDDEGSFIAWLEGYAKSLGRALSTDEHRAAESAWLATEKEKDSALLGGAAGANAERLKPVAAEDRD